MSGATPEEQDDLASLFGTFYDVKWKSSDAHEPGQVVRVPVPESRRRPWIGEVVRADGRSHTNARILIREQQEADFRGRENRLPIAALKLDAQHELIIARGKMRPCLVLGLPCEVNCRTLPEGAERNKALNSFSKRYILAPIYSTSRPNEPRAFGPTITTRIRGMMYPEFFYLGRSGMILKWPGVARLDHIFTNELVGCEPTDLKLGDQALAVLLEQTRILLGGTPSTEFREFRELLMTFIPTHCLEPTE